MSEANNPPEAKKTCPICGVEMVHATVCIACGHELPPDRIGALVLDKYRITEQLGKGGVGEVYAAVDELTKAPVAIKFLLGHWARVPEFRSRFRREAIALSRLRHPGIVSVLDFGEADGDLFLAMELLRGSPLSDLLVDPNTPPPLPRLVAIFDAILEVLEFTHAAAIVHRDLKPENVMILGGADEAVRVKILDFGLASIEEAEGAPRLTASGAVQGTPRYMSPEQCRGKRVGPPTDVYAVGIMLYEALAGAPPFESDVMAAFMAQHMFVEPRPMREMGAHREIAPGLEHLVRRAIAKEADARPSVRELRIALRAAVDGTDAAGIDARLAAERAGAAGLSREERAIGTGGLPFSPTVVTARPEVEPAVVVWGGDEARARALRDALAVNGFAASLCTTAAPPPLAGFAAVVLLGNPAAVDQARALRDVSKDVCLFVAGAVDAAQIVQLIRARVNDATLVGVGDDEVSRKVKRLVKRGR